MSFLILLFIFIIHNINGQTWGFLRRDYYVNQTIYPESLPIPYYGGRLYMIFTANKVNNEFPSYKEPYTVSLGVRESFTIDSNTKLTSDIDWIYCDYEQKTGQVLVSAHFPNDNFFSWWTRLYVTDADGNYLGKFNEPNVPHSGLELYRVNVIQISDTEQELVMHWYCYYDDAEYDVKNLYLNGILFDTAIQVGPLQHTVKSYKLNGTNMVNAGDIWNIHVQLYDGLQFGWGGRYGNPNQIWPVVVYPNVTDCAYPNINKGNYDTLVSDFNMNSIYINNMSTCGETPSNVIKYYSDNWDSNNDETLLLQSQYSVGNELSGINSNSIFALSVLDGYDGISPADEGITSKDGLTNKLHDIWVNSVNRRLSYPEYMTIINNYGSNSFGSFSGITDWQSTQFYITGCQPNSLANNTDFPVTAAYDYFVNAQQNAMPSSVIATVQAFKKWTSNDDPYITSSEVTIGIGSALAAGMNGIILKNGDLIEKSLDTDAWNAAIQLLSNIKYLSTQGILNRAAPNGASYNTTSNTAKIGILRSINELIIIVINMDCQGYNVKECDTTTPHWVCNQDKINTIYIDLPRDWIENGYTTFNTNEIINGKVTPINGFNINSVGNSFKWDGLTLTSTANTRIFVIKPDI